MPPADEVLDHKLSLCIIHFDPPSRARARTPTIVSTLSEVEEGNHDADLVCSKPYPSVAAATRLDSPRNTLIGSQYLLWS
jgi:hypothetical protein